MSFGDSEFISFRVFFEEKTETTFFEPPRIETVSASSLSLLCGKDALTRLQACQLDPFDSIFYKCSCSKEACQRQSQCPRNWQCQDLR